MSLDPEDRDLATRTVLGEAAHEGDTGMLGVAAVIANRVKAGRYGASVADVVLAPKQFEPWTTRRRELMAIDPDSPAYQRASALVDQAFAGEDPTGGATHFANVGTVKDRGDAAGRPGGWLSRMTNVSKIGNHTFGNADAGAGTGGGRRNSVMSALLDDRPAAQRGGSEHQDAPFSVDDAMASLSEDTTDPRRLAVRELIHDLLGDPDIADHTPGSDDEQDGDQPHLV